MVSEKNREMDGGQLGMPVAVTEEGASWAEKRDAMVEANLARLRMLAKDTLDRFASARQTGAEQNPEEEDDLDWTPSVEKNRRRLEHCAKRNNSEPGHLNEIDGIDCPICLNRGYTEEVQYHESVNYYSSVIVECKCKAQRRSWGLIQKSGLAKVLKELTFDRFAVDEPWRKELKQTALDYVADQGGHWLYIGGQSGSGKSHLCTAICGEFLRQNLPVRYMKWADESPRLKGMVIDDDAAERLRAYKECDVLYIDDFLKVQQSVFSNVYPSPADIKLAFQIIDYRYYTKKKTVISSEWGIDEVTELDEATGSRIYQMCGKYALHVNRNPAWNYRTMMGEKG